MRYKFRWIALTLCVGAGLHAAPETSQPVCSAPAPLPPSYAGWADTDTVIAATEIGGLAKAAMAAGRGTELGLHPDGQVTYITLPKGGGEAASFGGLAEIEITRPGIYHVGLGDFVWVDLVRGGKATDPLRFGHGPECTPIKKVVDFDLSAGTYTIELSGSKLSTTRLIIVEADGQHPNGALDGRE